MRSCVIAAAAISFLIAASESGMASIMLSVSGSRFDVEYSARFDIDYAGSGIFNAKLTNTTDASQSPEPLISRFAWNMEGEPVLNTDFTISDVSLSLWKLGTPKNGGIKFDYLGDNNDPSRLGAGDEITFKIEFISDYLDSYADPLSIFLDSDPNYGGIFGPAGTGQSIVKFEQLGTNDKSDLLGGNWERNSFAPIPEPASLICWSVMGGCGIFFTRKRKKQAKI